MLGSYCFFLCVSHMKTCMCGEYFCCFLALIRILFLSSRMRERGPRICGVGVWSLLLSLCLASLTHAHRSHTGTCTRTCTHVCLNNVLEDRQTSECSEQQHHQRLQQEGVSAANFFSRVVQLLWIGCFPPMGECWTKIYNETQEYTKNLFNERKKEKNFSSRCLYVLAAPSLWGDWGLFVCSRVTTQSECNKLCGLGIPRCEKSVQLELSGDTTTWLTANMSYTS